MLFKLNICQACAAKLRGILRERGEDAMAEAIGETLCQSCLRRVPGYGAGQRLVTQRKRTAPKPEGVG